MSRLFLKGLLCILAVDSCMGFSSYLDSISSKKDAAHPTSGSYLDSLDVSTVSSSKESEIGSFQPPVFDLNEVSERTPDDHYAKDHPGAGWAGYHHPMFGGYLNNLRENSFEDGKEADYGDDIRWGAQVYLDKI